MEPGQQSGCDGGCFIPPSRALLTVAYIVGRRWTYTIQLLPASACLPGPPIPLSIMQVRVKKNFMLGQLRMLQHVYLYGTVRPVSSVLLQIIIPGLSVDCV